MKVNLKFLYNLNTKEKFIIAVMILSAVGYIIYSLIVPPALAHYKIAKRQYLVQKKLIKSREEKAKSLTRLKGIFEDSKARMLKKKNLFFTEEESADFFKNLNQISVEEKVDLKKINHQDLEVISKSMQDKQQVLYYKRDTVNLVVYGKYKDILNFLKKLAGSGKILDISQLSLEPLEERSLMLEASFYLSLYILDSAH
ncbi:MAG: type 4a pilus biogenesis protein PilO [Candidatus Omnitrophota bacterium]